MMMMMIIKKNNKNDDEGSLQTLLDVSRMQYPVLQNIQLSFLPPLHQTKPSKKILHLCSSENDKPTDCQPLCSSLYNRYNNRIPLVHFKPSNVGTSQPTTSCSY